MPSFYNGKRFFLTFPTLDRSPQELVAYLQAKATVKSYVVARELHEDGQPHLHACVEFTSIQRHGVDWLDSFGIHPNKQDPRNWKACITYTKKGGDYIDGPEEEPEEDIETVLQSMDTEEQWMAYCINKKISFQYAQWYWERMKNDLCTIEGDEHEGVLCDELVNYKFNRDAKTALIIRGASGTGKTTWAKRNVPKPALFVRHIDTLKKFRPGFHKSIIFDDVEFNHYPRTAQIHLVDFENPSDIHCRHRTAFIPAGIYKVFTCNEWPLNVEDPAIKRRTHRVTINKL